CLLKSGSAAPTKSRRKQPIAIVLEGDQPRTSVIAKVRAQSKRKLMNGQFGPATICKRKCLLLFLQRFTDRSVGGPGLGFEFVVPEIVEGAGLYDHEILARLDIDELKEDALGAERVIVAGQQPPLVSVSNLRSGNYFSE